MASERSADAIKVFHPKILSSLKTCTTADFLSDLTAGVIVGIVALPLAIAFAIASGVTPDRGLVTAIVAGFLISALGGSRVQIGGPTGAFVVIIYKIVQQYGMDGLTIATLIAGALLIGMGIFRLGTFIKYIPYPLTVGFTSGIAVIILSSQIKDFFGLQIGALPADFVEKCAVYAKHFGSLDSTTAGLSILTLAIIVAWPRVNRRIPGSIVAIVLITTLVHWLKLPVETIGSRFGDLPAGLPSPHWPVIEFSRWRQLVSPAFTIAMLGAIESLLSATVADGMIGGRHRSNTELIAQGIANIASGIFGGIPATGAIARTATNVKNGGRTPIAGIIHALTLLLIVLLLGRWAKLIPLCVLAAILVVVSYHMSEWHSFVALLKAPRSDVAVLVTTFLLTVFVDLTVAVEIGMMLAMALFIRRMSEVSSVRQLQSEILLTDKGDNNESESVSLPEGVLAYEAQGALVFGMVESLRDVMGFGAKPPKVLILVLKQVLALDATAIRALSDLYNACRKSGTQFVLSGVHSQPRAALEKAGFIAQIGKENVIAGNLRQVIARLNDRPAAL